MKLGKSVLLEIIAIVQEGLTTGSDISQKLRDLDLERVSSDDSEILELSDEYRSSHHRVEEPN